MIIKPTVGRKVWYRPSKSDLTGTVPMSITAGPLDATIIAVWGDRMVNVLVTDIVGKQFPVLSCTLLQEGDEVPKDIDGNIAGRFVEWMPYQQVQAHKTESEMVASAADAADELKAGTPATQ